MTQVIYFLIANLPVGIGVRAQVDSLADTVDLPHGIFPGEIKYFHGEFKAAHINGCEGFYTHKVPHFPNR